MAKTRLDEALDQLFSAPVDDFMETRETLAATLRDAGDKEAAATVKGQHKPTLAAHALNQLARSARAELEALFEASRKLSTGEDFKSALEQQRAALEKVRAKISGGDAIELVNVLRGAMVDETLAARVRIGHFSKLPEVQVGFFGAAPLGGPPRAEAPAKKSAKGAKKEPALPAIDRTELDRARAAKEEKDRAAREKAEREKAERERAERKARLARELAAAEAELKELNAIAVDAERKADQARRQAKVVADRVAAMRERQSAID